MSVTFYSYPNFNQNEDYTRWDDIMQVRWQGADEPGRSPVMPFRNAERCGCSSTNSKSDKSWHDDIDSIDVKNGAVLRIYEGHNYTGKSYDVTEPVGDLRNTDVGRNEVSSFKTFINCNHPAQTWSDLCLNNRTNLIYQNSHTCGPDSECYRNRTDWCNSSISNAKDPRCEKWCQRAQANACTVRDRIMQCKEFGLSESNCSGLEDMVNKCKVYGITNRVTNQQDALSEYPCTVAGVKELESDCQKLDIPLSICNTARIYNEKQRLEMRNEAQKTRDAYLQASREAIDAITEGTQKLIETIEASGENQIKAFREYYTSEREFKKQQFRDMKSEFLQMLGYSDNNNNDDYLFYIVIGTIICVTSMSSVFGGLAVVAMQ